MPTLPRSGRRSAHARRQLFAVLTAAFLLFQQAIIFAPTASAQVRRATTIDKTTVTKAPVSSGIKQAPAPALDDTGGPNDTGTGSVSLTTAGVAAPTETFDTLSNTAGSTTNTALPTGWYITETGGGARDNEQYAVDTGGSTAGDIYSYGAAAATDRALGALRSGTLIPLFGAKFTNNTGAAITSLAVAYTGEEWRLGTAARTDQINFEISTNATDLSTGTYTGVAALNFVTPDTVTTGAKNGNAAADRTALSTTIGSLNIPNGASFFIRWTDTDATGADDGLAVDDFSITPNPAGPPTLSVNDVSQDEGNAGTTAFTFTVSLSSATHPTVTFNIATADGTAQDGNPGGEDNDYQANSATGVTIPNGTQSAQFTVNVNGDGTTEPNETFFVNVTSVSGATVADGQGQGTIQNDDFTLTPIHDIQGNGTSSPVATQSVTTTGIVTGIKAGSSGGFFIQEPDATVDADPNTSEGVFVFTGGSLPAGAVVGNLVRVSGTVAEFVFNSDPNSPPITELSSVTSTAVLSTGNPLPTPHTITAAETVAASGTTDPLDSLEEFEGMRVTVPSLTVTGPTQGTITEPSATVSSTGVFYGVVTGVARPFREAGVAVSDTLPAGAPANVPRFDENPERIRVDSDGQPGTAPLNVSAGTTVSNVTGPLDYQFRTYTILPDTTLTGTNSGATPAPAANADEFTVASFNMERFFDTTDAPGISDPVLTTTAFNNRLNKASLIVRNVQRYPDVIGVQEVENLSTLQAVAAKINSDAQSIDGQPDPQYTAYLVEGNDIGGIDVGFLVKQSRVSVVDVTQIEQPGCDHVTPSTCNNYTNPNDGTLDILNDRPPLVLRATVNRPAGGTAAFTIINNHLRSLNGIDDATVQGSGTVGARVREKRRKGAEFLANYIQSRQTNDPAEKIITVGDLNALRVNDGYVDVIGTILGTPTPADQVVLASSDLVNPDQTDLVDTLAADQRYSYTFDGNAQTLDHVIVNPAARAILTRFAYARDDADQPVVDYADPNVPDRISDHDQPVAYFSLNVAPAAGSVIISEFRFRGPSATEGGGEVGPVSHGATDGGGPNAPGSAQDNDEFVELYNNTDSEITVATLDGSAGWAVVAADGVTRFIIPNDTVIPARGHFLGVNIDGYSLGSYGVPDEVLLPSDTSTTVNGYSLDIPDGSGIALFGTADPSHYTLATRLDAAGYATVDALYREGAGFPAAGAEATSDLEYSFVRKVCVFGGPGCGGPSLPKDTSDNANDFAVVNTQAAATTLGAKLGAPGPEGLTSPINGNAGLPGSLLDPSVSASQPPNRVRDFTSNPANNSSFGTLSIRRTITNNTGSPVRFLAFRIIDITTFPVPAGTADLRAIDSDDIQVTVNGDLVDVLGTYVEQPPTQPNGGGLNSSMAVGSINLASPLPSGESANVQFLLGIQQTGGYRFYVSIEMINDGLVPEGPVSLGARNLKKLRQEQHQRRRPQRNQK